MEPVTDIVKPSPEHRKTEVRSHKYVELKALQALERVEKRKKVREESEKVTEILRRKRGEFMEEWKRQEEAKEERRANGVKAAVKNKEEDMEKFCWLEAMKVQEEQVRQRMLSLKKEQQRRRKELYRVQKQREEASTERPAFDLKKAEGRKTTLYNNWVGEETNQQDSKPAQEKVNPNSATFRLFLAKPGPKSDEIPETRKSSETMRWILSRLSVGFWIEKFQEHRQRRQEKRLLKLEEEYERYAASVFEPRQPVE